MSSKDMSASVATTNVPEDTSFCTYFWHIFRKSKHTDVEFDLLGPDGPVTFSVHKMVLSLWSPYFADKFYGTESVADDVNIIQLNDVDAGAFLAMLEFTYGYIPELETHKKACELYKVAMKFKVTGLMKLCREILNEIQVVPSNVFDILEASEYMENRILTDRCLNLIKVNTEEVLEAYDLAEISSPMLHALLDLHELSLNGEYELLMWLFSWAVHKRDKDPKEYSSSRDALQKFLPKVDILSLSNVEFATLYQKQEAFFSKDEAVSIFTNLAVPGSVKMPEWYDENRPSRVYKKQVSDIVEDA